MPDGWTDVDPTTATFTVELTGATCDAVTPVAPTVTQAICRNGVLEAPDIDDVDDRRDHLHDGCRSAVRAGQTVVVTATLDDAGVGWPDQLPTAGPRRMRRRRPTR